MQALKRTFGYLNSHPISRRHKLHAYYHFLRWQIFSRIKKGKLYVMPFVGSTRFFAKRQLTGITGSIYTGLQDFEEMSFLLHFLREDDCFFDVGSNVGAYTILASGVKRAKSLAFEPNATTFDLLTKNVALNEIQSIVTCENKAIGRESGTLKFTVDGDTTNHVVSDAESSLASYEEVAVVNLDSYSDYCQVTMMKIDVEGFETEVIEGARSILAQESLKVILIELNGSGGRYGYDDNDIHRRLVDLSFQPYIYEPFTRALVKQPSFGSFNTLYIRDIDFVNHRLKASEPFTVWNTVI